MSELDEFLKKIDDASREELKRLLQPVKVRRLHIDPGDEDFNRYYLETESAVRLGKILASAVRLSETIRLAVTGARGSGVTVALKYIHSKLSSFFNGCIDDIQAGECDYLILTNSANAPNSKKLRENIVIAELTPFTSRELLLNKRTDWRVAVYSGPKCSELNVILEKRFGEKLVSGELMNTLCSIGSIKLALLTAIYGPDAVGLNLTHNFWDLPYKKKEILAFLSSVKDPRGVCLETLAKFFGNRSSTMRKHLETLESEGFVSRKREGRKTRYFVPREAVKAVATKWLINEMLEFGAVKL